MHKFFGTDSIVWDKDNQKILCQFKNGIFETSEERTIKILSSLGYPFEAEEEKKDEHTTANKLVRAGKSKSSRSNNNK